MERGIDMKEFDFDKFEKHIPEFTARLKEQMQTRLFNPIAPDFEVTVSVYDQGRGYGKRIAVETTDIVERMNFKMFDEMRLHNFGGNAVKNSRKYWLPIDWRWQNFGGGGNGTTAFTVYLNDSGEITKVRDED
jgi:hypothetical protein